MEIPRRCLGDSSFVSGRITASVHRKSEASHVELEARCRLPRIFDNRDLGNVGGIVDEDTFSATVTFGP